MQDKYRKCYLCGENDYASISSITSLHFSCYFIDMTNYLMISVLMNDNY